MHEGLFVVIVLGLFILGGIAVIWMGIQSRRQIREMEHRERLAMIERGLVPSPEMDPGAFEERMARSRVRETPGSVRSRTAGIMMIGLGLALMFMISLVGEVPSVGIGVGGAFAVLGAAFFANAVMLNRSQPYVPPTPTYAPPGRFQKPEPPDTPPPSV